MNKKIYTCFLFCLPMLGAFTQSIGEWRMHVNYLSSIDLAVSPSRIISANEKSLLEYNFMDGSVRTLDKVKGLSDFGVSSIAYDETTNTFIVAYLNSNLDLIKGNTIINLPDIKNKLTAGSKNINDIMTYEGKAYVSTDFGVVQVDLVNEEIDNTYVIGSTGNQTVVFDCSISQDSIFAITQEGLKRAALSSANLLDYSSWDHNFSNLNGITEIEVFNDTLFGIANGLHHYYNGVWAEDYNSGTSTFKALKSSEILTLVADNFHVLQYHRDSLDTLSTSFLIDPTSSVLYNGRSIHGDLKGGLFIENRSISANSSPFTNDGFKASSFGDAIAISAGGFNDNLDPEGNLEAGFYVFENDNWSNHNIYTSLGSSVPVQDLNYLVYNEFNGKLYIAMFQGLIEFNFPDNTIFNDQNSPLELYTGLNGITAVTGVDIDSYGNVWMINPSTTAALKTLSLDGTWHSFTLGNDNTKLFNLFIDSYDQKWLCLREQGLYIYKEGENLSSSGSQYLSLSTNANQGNLPNNNVNTIVEDKDGQIWVGTDEGIAVFNCPEGILDATTACRVSDRITNTLDIYTEYLFETDRVNAIEVDGANRKWIGTSAGVFLLSEDGKTEIHRFNTENSPLPSNTINDITINKGTGEVFILTDLGMVSYFSDATEGAENHSQIKAYPNPVRPEYTGYISITGLVEGSFVKITDAHGVLINEGFALGGKYTWDGNDYNGRRANSGVYYIFSANSDASEKAVTKIAFVK